VRVVGQEFGVGFLEFFVKCCERANVSQIELMMLVP
jgi:hypothetical protein